jgi:hypothetical protein
MNFEDKLKKDVGIVTRIRTGVSENPKKTECFLFPTF